MHEMTVGVNDAGQRLDKFLQKALPGLPASLLYKSLRTKKIKVNRKRGEPGQILAAGDVLQLFLPDEFFVRPEERNLQSLLVHTTVQPEILYEDENLILLYKPQGVSVHADQDGEPGGTLLLQMQAYLYRKGEYDPLSEQSFAPALCNRIDRNTEGIVIGAKNAAALRDMNRLIRERALSKYYLCAVNGTPSVLQGVITGYLCKDERTNQVRVYDHHPPAGAKRIVTGYRTLCTVSGRSLLQVHLITGRTHQIRAHLAHIGCPLYGDGKYGVNRGARRAGYAYQCLVAYRLCFDLPGDPGIFGYLKGRVFSVPPERIGFLHLFGDGKTVAQLLESVQ